MGIVEPKYVRAPDGWKPELPNPFYVSGKYGSQWSCLEIIDNSDIQLHYHGHCRNDRGLFHCQIGCNSPKFTIVLGDFLSYESAHGRTVILTCPEDMNANELVQHALANVHDVSFVRNDDPKFMVHSTLPDRWEKIKTSGALWSSMRLKKQGLNFPEIGYEQLGEPKDFREYIVLGTLNSTAPEHVVASHTKGCVFTEEDTPYEPGVRLYFNAHRIITDGLAVRDGLHKLKIHDHLNLEPYLIAAVGV